MKTIIKRPLVSEKIMSLNKIGKYVFLADNQANSREIKQEIEAIYKVKVEAVNLVNQKGKMKRLGGRAVGRKPDFKKAIVTLKSGQTIDIMPK